MRNETKKKRERYFIIKGQYECEIYGINVIVEENNTSYVRKTEAYICDKIFFVCIEGKESKRNIRFRMEFGSF
jgi:hypothetical protein